MLLAESKIIKMEEYKLPKRKIISLVLISLFCNFIGCSKSSSEINKSGFPGTSASAITSPPSNMDGINTHSHVYGTGADPGVITLGPKEGGQPGWEPYQNKTSMEFELASGAPVIAPIDMVLVGFDNRSAQFRDVEDGERLSPFNDLELCFESVNEDWPGMIICVYHLLSSPLISGHYQNPECAEVEKWQGTFQAQGHLFFEFDDYILPETQITQPCNAQIGKLVKRGGLIGFAGSVGNHSMISIRIKVPHSTKNKLVRRGNEYYHWVQPGTFFYWKCNTLNTSFPNGVLAYPFECDGFQLPIEMRDPGFKYSS